MCAKIERYIGTEGGGMDQAIEVLGKSGCAMMINFNPLKVEEVPVPKGALFAVLHCGTTLTKSTTSNYNQRVVECRIAAQVLQVHMNFFFCKCMNFEEERKIVTY